MKSNKIAVVGCGFVGQAVVGAFSGADVIEIDPKLGVVLGETPIDFSDCRAAFVCVPTPQSESGEINSSIVEDCLEKLYHLTEDNCLLILKSTVVPSKVDEFAKKYGEQFVYNPEFLVEKTALQDFINPSMTVFGVADYSKSTELLNLYLELSSCNITQAPIYTVSPAEAAFIKYTINSFLATKVTWFNELKDVIDKTPGVDFDSVAMVANSDPRLGGSHYRVPGPDGRRGFGGACFPKDTKAFTAEYPQMTLVKAAVEKNILYRSGYDLDDREKEQHITFD